jgi:histidinol-phosphatase
MSPRLAFALEAAIRAARVTLATFQCGSRGERKTDGSPVTVADRECERVLREAIGARFPGEAILGEEEGGDAAASSRWVIDPIDGTKSFICGVPLYGTLISFEEGGETLVAVAYFPALDDAVYAELGAGCFWNGRPCKVSSTKRVEDAIVCCGSPASFRARSREAGWLKLSHEAWSVRGWSDAYAHSLVATGRVDAMIDPSLAVWDISATKLIVREAGGEYTDFAGGRDPKDEAIASNGFLHRDLLEAFGA